MLFHLPRPHLATGASLQCVHARQGSWGCPGRRARPAAGGSAWRGGGGRGGLCAALPGGVAGGPGGAGGCSASVRPSAFPGWAIKRVSLATLRSGRAWPPYCFGSRSRAAPGRGPFIVLVRWPGLARLSRPPREQAVGGVGARGVRARLGPPPGAPAPSGGGGSSPLPQGGSRAGAPVVRRPEGGVGGRGERGSRRGSPPPCPGQVARDPPAQSPSFSGAPPLGIYVQPGLPGSPGRRARLGRSLVGQPGGGGGGGCQCAVPPGARSRGPAGRGAGRSLCRGVSPRLPRGGTKAGLFVCAPPSMLHSWVLPFRCGPGGALERRRRAAGRQKALRE